MDPTWGWLAGAIQCTDPILHARSSHVLAQLPPLTPSWPDLAVCWPDIVCRMTLFSLSVFLQVWKLMLLPVLHYQISEPVGNLLG